MTINSFCLYVPPKLAEPASLVELMSSEDFKRCIGGTTPGIFKREGGVPGYIGLIQDSSGIYLRIGRTTITDTDLRTILKNGDFSKNSGNKESFLAPYGQYCAINIDFGQHNCIRVLTDPMGVRSVFVRQCAAGGWIICSQISDFKDIDENLEMDSQARDFLLRYAYLREGVSLYQQVVELYPAKVYELTRENIECDLNHVNIGGETGIESKDTIQGLDEIMQSVIREQLGQAKKVGVLLGGFDSALVAAYLVRLGVDVEAFSFSYQEKHFNQPLAEEVCQFLGIKHHWVDISVVEFERALFEYSKYCNVPTVWPGYIIQTKMLCERMLAAGVEACFSGDGCDTLFMGYPSTYRRGSVYKKLPELNHTFVSVMTKLFDSLGMEALFGHVYRVFRSMLDASTRNEKNRPFHSFQVFNDSSLEKLGFSPSGSTMENAAWFSRLEKDFESLSYYRKMYHAKSLISPNRQKLLASSSATGMNVESPYMHPRMKKYAATIPEEFLRVEGRAATDEGKELLMEMAEKYNLLPMEVIRQKKVAAIRSPIDSWIAKDMSREIYNKLMAKKPASSGYIKSLINDLFAEKIYKNHFSSDMVTSLAISLIITYLTFEV